MSSHKSTVRARRKPEPTAEPESLDRFADRPKRRSLAWSAQPEYLRYLRKLAATMKRDPAAFHVAAIREHLL